MLPPPPQSNHIILHKVKVTIIANALCMAIGKPCLYEQYTTFCISVTGKRL